MTVQFVLNYTFCLTRLTAANVTISSFDNKLEFEKKPDPMTGGYFDLITQRLGKLHVDYF